MPRPVHAHRCVATLLALLVSAFWSVSRLGADEPPPTKTISAATLSLREALFDELAADAQRFEQQFGIIKRVVRLVRPTIVHIDAYAPTSQGVAELDEAGSGIIVQFDKGFYVLTNRHVVDGSSLDDLKIRTDDGLRLDTLRMWSDKDTDVAVIEVADKQLLPARLGDSDVVDIGDFVLAVGSPFGLSHSVTYGIVSAKGRWDLALGDSQNVRFQDFLQTDAAINPGNSGGPLLNLKGEVIGINTAIASNSGGNEGIGFSIPINLAVHVAKQLVQEGAVATAYLGVVLDRDFSSRLSDDRKLAVQLGLKRARGALVKAITPGSPAATARFQEGDIVVEYDGVRVQDDDHLVNLVSLTPLNEVVSVNVIRKKQSYLVHVRLGRRQDFEAPEAKVAVPRTKNVRQQRRSR